jgi:hypothetical protein
MAVVECGGARGCRGAGCVSRLVTPGSQEVIEADYLQQQQQQVQASQKPYRVGLILLCMGALFNWLGLAQAYVEPMRYVGVGCIVAGALLICAAMCRWLGRSTPRHSSSFTTVSKIFSLKLLANFQNVVPDLCEDIFSSNEKFTREK